MLPTRFTDSDLTSLYGTAHRLAARTSALRAAKVAGGDATATIGALAARFHRPGGVVCDIGCGRGSTTLALANRFAPSVLIALDRFPALLDVVRSRFAAVGRGVHTVCADFHHLPMRDTGADLIVAAFCLYHAPDPSAVLAEIHRALVPGGTAVLATKSADSYRQLDELIADSSLDPDARHRPSPWASFHTGNAAAVAKRALVVEAVEHERHEFFFADLAHAAAYAVTSPKYRFPPELAGNAGALAARLRERLPDQPVTATSTVTYVIATRP